MKERAYYNMKNLVIFYSLEGNTRLMAETIAKEVNADILELIPKKKYADSGLKNSLGWNKCII